MGSAIYGAGEFWSHLKTINLGDSSAIIFGVGQFRMKSHIHLPTYAASIWSSFEQINELSIKLLGKMASPCTSHCEVSLLSMQTWSFTTLVVMGYLHLFCVIFPTTPIMKSYLKTVWSLRPPLIKPELKVNRHSHLKILVTILLSIYPDVAPYNIWAKYLVGIWHLI